MKGNIKYFVLRIVLLIGLLVVLSQVYALYFHPETLKKEGWLKALGERAFQNKSDILYFSASPNATYSPTDTDHRSISQMLEDTLDGLTVTSLDTGAIHAGVFLHALHQLPKEKLPKTIVMDYTLRSFGPQWILSPLENSLQRNLNYWNSRPALFNRMNAALRNYEYLPPGERNAQIKYHEEFDVLPFSGACSTVDSWRDSIIRSYNGDLLMGESVRHFGFTITPENPMLKDYYRIRSWCLKNKVKLVLVILPEKVSFLKSSAGENLITLCHQNARVLEKIALPGKCEVVNLLADFNEYYFFESFLTEHYHAIGRKHIAQKIADKIQ